MLLHALSMDNGTNSWVDSSKLAMVFWNRVGRRGEMNGMRESTVACAHLTAFWSASKRPSEYNQGH